MSIQQKFKIFVLLESRTHVDRFQIVANLNQFFENYPQNWKKKIKHRVSNSVYINKNNFVQ